MKSENKDAIFTGLAAMGQSLANPHRLRIVSLLSHGEKTVERLAEAIGQSLAATSAHLKVLRAAGLVAADKRGKHVFCRLASDDVATLWLALRNLGEHLLPEVREARRQLETGDDALSPLSEEETWRGIEKGRSVVVDLRPADEYAAGHLPRARHIPYAQLDELAGQLPKSRPLLVYCRGPYCLMAIDGVRRLVQQKYPARRLRFSVPEWRAAGLPVETSPPALLGRGTPSQAGCSATVEYRRFANARNIASPRR